MASFRIEWKQSAEKELRKLDKAAIPRILEAVEALGANPYPAGTKNLQGTERTYRIRIGDYRVVYSVHPEVLLVNVVRIGHRKDIYRGFV